MGTGKRAYRDFAVFLRVNALSRGLETAFVRQRVPFQIVKGLAFFDRKENKDVSLICVSWSIRATTFLSAR